MMKAGGSKYYFATNHLYSVAALTDSTGAVVERYKYDAYGRQGIMNQNGTVSYCPSDYGNFVGFTGRYHDWETGLTYFRTRYEDPRLGRFLNRMPWFEMNGLELSNYNKIEMPRNQRAFMSKALSKSLGSYIQNRYNLYDFMLQDPANILEPFSSAENGEDAEKEAEAEEIIRRKFGDPENPDDPNNHIEPTPRPGGNTGNYVQDPNGDPIVLPNRVCPVGSRRNPFNEPGGPPRNEDELIDGRVYSGHALDQMENRGVPLSAVQQALNGSPTPDKTEGRSDYYDAINKLTVVVDTATGRIITIFYGYG